MTITWQNIDAPRFGAANNLLSSSTKQITTGIQNLSDSLNVLDKKQKAEIAQTKKLNTDSVLATLDGITSSEGLSERSAEFTPAALKEQYGKDVDVKAITGAVKNLRNSLEKNERKDVLQARDDVAYERETAAYERAQAKLPRKDQMADWSFIESQDQANEMQRTISERGIIEGFNNDLANARGISDLQALRTKINASTVRDKPNLMMNIDERIAKQASENFDNQLVEQEVRNLDGKIEIANMTRAQQQAYFADQLESYENEVKSIGGYNWEDTSTTGELVQKALKATGLDYDETLMPFDIAGAEILEYVEQLNNDRGKDGKEPYDPRVIEKAIYDTPKYGSEKSKGFTDLRINKTKFKNQIEFENKRFEKAKGDFERLQFKRRELAIKRAKNSIDRSEYINSFFQDK